MTKSHEASPKLLTDVPSLDLWLDGPVEVGLDKLPKIFELTLPRVIDVCTEPYVGQYDFRIDRVSVPVEYISRENESANFRIYIEKPTPDDQTPVGLLLDAGEGGQFLVMTFTRSQFTYPGINNALERRNRPEDMTAFFDVLSEIDGQPQTRFL